MELALSASEKLIQVAAGNGFSLGLCLPLSAESRTGQNAVIDAVNFGREEQQFSFNTIEVDKAQEHAPLIRSSLNMTSTTSVRTSVPFTPMVEPSRQSNHAFTPMVEPSRQSNHAFTPMVEPSRPSQAGAGGVSCEMNASGGTRGMNTSDMSRGRSAGGSSAVESSVQNGGEDICFQSRLNRAAALEKQFQALLRK